MPTFNGNDGVITVGAAVVASIVDISVEEAASTVDDTPLGATSTSAKSGTKSWSGSLNCYLDISDATGQELLLNGAEVTITFYPYGNATGKHSLSGTIIVGAVTVSSAQDTTVPRAFTFTGVGDLVHAVVA